MDSHHIIDTYPFTAYVERVLRRVPLHDADHQSSWVSRPIYNMPKPTAATSQKFARCIDCIALSYYTACLYINKYVCIAIIIIYNNYYYRYYHYDIGTARFTPSPRKRLLFRYANVPRANNHVSKTAPKRCRRRRLDGPSVYYHIQYLHN